MKKALIILNDSLQEMTVGKSSNLAYICACLELGFEVFVYILPRSDFFANKVLTREFKGLELVELYKKFNLDLKKNVKLKDLDCFACARNDAVGDEFLIGNDAVRDGDDDMLTEINLNEMDLIIQRLEPMKAPFPPFGDENINEIFKLIAQKFPNKIINLPINLSDKGAVSLVDEILAKKGLEKIGVETKEFLALDENFPEIYEKTVIKPKNLAQSVGVFALEKSPDGFDLEMLKNELIENLTNVQIYKIKNNLEKSQLKEIILILLAAQSLKSDENLLKKYQKFSEIDKDKLIEIVNNLYHEILLQPFIDGVKFGDIRTLLLKNAQNKFYVAGNVFRKNSRVNDDENFTTCYSTGASSASKIEELTLDEQKDLKEKTQKLLEILNEDLAEIYENSLELGVDFILKGDLKTVLLGEINHTCIALLPVFEALYKEDKNYDGGLFFIKKAILDVVLRQSVN
jgi:hypothetical protein